MAEDIKTLTKKDFVSDQDIKWCPGCGDYSILNSVQKQLFELTGNKFSKKYVETYILPIIKYITSSKEKMFEVLYSFHNNL